MNQQKEPSDFDSLRAFSARGLDSPISFKSIADNFRDYTLLSIFLKCVIISVKGAPVYMFLALFFPVVLMLPIAFSVVFIRTNLIIYHLATEDVELPPFNRIAVAIVSFYWGSAIVYTVFKGLSVISKWP